MDKEKMIFEAKTKIKIYSSLLDSIEENGGILTIKLLERRLRAERVMLEVLKGYEEGAEV